MHKTSYLLVVEGRYDPLSTLLVQKRNFTYDRGFRTGEPAMVNLTPYRREHGLYVCSRGTPREIARNHSPKTTRASYTEVTDAVAGAAADVGLLSYLTACLV